MWILLWLNAQIVRTWDDVLESGIPAVVPVQVLDLVHIVQGRVIVRIPRPHAGPASRAVIPDKNELDLEISLAVVQQAHAFLLVLVLDHRLCAGVLHPILIELLDTEIEPSLLFHIEF